MAAAAMASRVGGTHAAGIYADMTVDGPEIGTLVLVIDRAKNLPNRKTVGKQNPYCAARLGKEAKKTDTDMRGGQTPKWDQELRWTVHDSPDYYKMKVSVFSEDKRTDLIGETFISLESVIVPGGGKNDLWHTLNYKGRYAGEIRIEITYWDSRPRAEPPVKRSADSGSQSQRRPLPSEARRFDSPPMQIPGGRREPDQAVSVQQRTMPQMRMHNSDPSVLQSDGSFNGKARAQSQEQKNREAFEFRQAQARRLGGGDNLPRHEERGSTSTPKPVYQGMALPELPHHAPQQRASMSNLSELRQAGQRPSEYLMEQQRHLHDDRTATMRSLPPQQTHSSLVPQGYGSSTPLRYAQTNQDHGHHHQQQYESPPSNVDNSITPWRDEYYHQDYDDNSATPWRNQNQYDLSHSEDNSSTPWRNQYQNDRQDDYNVTPWRQNYQNSSPPNIHNAPAPPQHRGSGGPGQLVALPPPDQQQAMLQHLYRPVAQRPQDNSHPRQVSGQRPYSSDDRALTSYHNQNQNNQRYDAAYDLAYADAPFPPAPPQFYQQQQQIQNSPPQGLPPRTSSRLDPPNLPFAQSSHHHRRSEPNIRAPFGQSPPQSQSQSYNQNRGSTGVPVRKSISPNITTPNNSHSKQLSSTAFSPDSFDTLNPQVSSSTKSTPQYKTPSESKTAAREVATLKKRQAEAARGPVLGNNGRVIDPSDHLPSDTWAPEPEKKNSNSPQSEKKFRGAQPMPPSGSGGRPSSMSAIQSTSAGYASSESPLREISNYNYDEGRYVGQPPPVPAKIALDNSGKRTGRENGSGSSGSASLADAMGKLDVSGKGTGTGRLRRSRWGA